MEKESKQEGVAEEQVKEETSKPVSEVTSTEEKATSAKQGIDDEWKGKMQSRTDKAEHETKTTKETLQSVQTQLQTLRDGIERQRKEDRRKELEAVADDPEQRGLVLRKQDLEDLELIHDNKWAKALELAGKYGFENIADILIADTPKEMELMAKLKAQPEAEKEKTETKTPPKEEAGFTPDSGTSDAGGEDDTTFLKNYSEGKSDDHARARKLLAKIK